MKKNRVLYAIIIVAALILVYFEEGRMSYTFLYTVLMMPVLSLIMCKLSLHYLSITQTTDKGLIIKGEETNFRILATNRGYFITPMLSFIFVKAHYAIRTNADNIMLTMPARSKQGISFGVTSAYRGVYNVGLETVQAKDYLGLITLSRQWNDKVQLVVYPRVIELANVPVSMNLMTKTYSRHQIREEDYSAISDTRPYLPSDSMKRIHWKLSAKKSSLIVKNYENTALNSMIVVWDRLQVKGDEQYSVIAEDKIVEIVVALSHYCLKKMIPIDLFYGEEEPIIAANLSEFDKIFTCAAHSEFLQTEMLEVMLGSILGNQSSQVNISVITSNLTEILLDELVGAYYFGHHVVLVYVPPQNDSDQANGMVNSLQEIGMKVYRINIDDDILDYF